MTEFSTKKHAKGCDIAVCWSAIVSNPLYLSYLIFFFPYIFKLLSFLSPLFITVSLLLLSLLTTFVPLKSLINPKDGFFLSVYAPLVEKLRPRFDESTEELEVYKIVFEDTIIEVNVGDHDERERDGDTQDENLVEKGEENDNAAQDEVKTEYEVSETGDANPNERKHEVIMMRTGSEVIKKKINEVLRPKFGSLRVDQEKTTLTNEGQTYLGSFGSMRKEREWRRTLACKLFEERHNKVNQSNVSGGEGMDLLWETYETDVNKGRTEEKVGFKKGKGEVIGDFIKRNDIESSVYSFDEDEEYDDDSAKVCCLQALKLSAGKMNLNMGRPSLLKIGKAFKGFGWLHGKKQGKKGYK